MDANDPKMIHSFRSASSRQVFKHQQSNIIHFGYLFFSQPMISLYWWRCSLLLFTVHLSQRSCGAAAPHCVSGSNAAEWKDTAAAWGPELALKHTHLIIKITIIFIITLDNKNRIWMLVLSIFMQHHSCPFFCLEIITVQYQYVDPAAFQHTTVSTLVPDTIVPLSPETHSDRGWEASAQKQNAQEMNEQLETSTRPRDEGRMQATGKSWGGNEEERRVG